VVEEVEENNGSDEASARDTSVHPDEIRVLGHRDQGLRDCRTESVGEEVQTLNERLHGGRGFGIGVFEASDRNENFSEANEHISGCLNSNVYIVGESLAVDDGGIALEGIFVARASRINKMLDDSSIAKAERNPYKTQSDSRNRADVNSSLAEGGIDEEVEYRRKNKNRDGIEVLHEIVGHAVAIHLTSLGDEVG